MTGDEGHGKSTLLRQLAMQFSAGIHPFTLADMPPCRVLLLDLENSHRQTRRALAPLWSNVSSLRRNQIIPLIRTEGIDLLTEEDREWFADRVKVNLPDVLIAGPLYKMASGEPNSEEPARVVAGFLDGLRAEYEIAIVLVVRR